MKSYVILFLCILGTGAILCPDKEKECPHGSTCCHISKDSFGCCPMLDAVCCPDYIHCCGQGAICGPHGCIRENNASKPLTQLRVPMMSKLCPGGVQTCPDNSTCCADGKGKVYGCCLIPDAVCCADEQHCCPPNYMCDAKQQKCLSKTKHSTLMFSAKKNLHMLEDTLGDSKAKLNIINPNSYRKSKVGSIICPGGTFQCPDGYTCCQLPSHDWGCCPFPEATCCEDHLHCCPTHMKCDSTSKSCVQGLHNVTWAEHVPAFPLL